MSGNKLHMWGPVDTRNSPLVYLDMSFNNLSVSPAAALRLQQLRFAAPFLEFRAPGSSLAA